MAGSAALWKLGRVQPILAGSWGPFSSTYSFSGSRCNSLLLSQPTPTPMLLSSSLSQAHAIAVLCGLPPRQCCPCSRPRPFFAGHCRRLLAEPFLLFSLHSNGLEARWNPNPFSIYAMWSFWSWISVSRGSMKDLERFLMVESSWFWISPVGWFWGERQCHPWDH